MIEKFSEQDLIQELVAIARANGQPASAALAERKIWEYFCAREPERMVNGDPVGGESQDSDVLIPERWGPWIWNFLNLAAIRFSQQFFFDLLAQIPGIMTCEECRAHWRGIVKNNPPEGITDAQSACHWVNDRHNEVNALLGKRPYSYEQMVADFGAPP